MAIGGQSALTGSQEVAPGSTRKSNSPKSILLAEDSLINQKLAIGLLEKWGHRVTVANDGREAVDLSGQRMFDLVLMDVQMPELDGLDATRSIRHREELTGVHLPIVAMTAHAMKGDRERCLEAGMDDYLTKPIRAEQLFQAVERIGAGTEVVGGIAGPTEVVPMVGDRVDWDLAHRAVNHDEELLHHVVDAFFEESPQLIEAMRESVVSKDWKRFQRAAHTLKSGLRMFGVVSLADDVERLELSVKSGELRPDLGEIMNLVIERSRGILAEMTSYSARSQK